MKKWKGRNLLAGIHVLKGEYDLMQKWPCSLEANITIHYLQDRINVSSSYHVIWNKTMLSACKTNKIWPTSLTNIIAENTVDYSSIELDYMRAHCSAILEPTVITVQLFIHFLEEPKKAI